MNVELVLWLKDMVSGGIRKTEATTRSAFGGIDRSVAGTQAKMQGLGAAAGQIGNPLVSAANRASRAINDVGNAADQAKRKVDGLNGSLKGGLFGGAHNDRGGGGGGGMLGGIVSGTFLGTMAAQGVGRVASAVMGQLKDVMGGGMEAGAMQEQFKVLAGDKQGTDLYGEIKKYVKDSVFGPELYGNARTMMAFGIDPKEVMGDMKMLGDVAMGNKEKMDLLTLAFAQTKSAGHLMGQDLLQYVNAGFNPLMVLADKTGKKYEDLKDQMSEGKISAEMVKEAFVIATSEGGKYHGMLDKMAKTPFGKLQAMQGSIQDAKVGLGVGMAPAISRLLDGLKPMVDGLPAMMDRLVPVMDRAFSRIDEMLPAVQGFGRELLGILKPIGGLLLSDEVGGMAKSMMELTTAIMGSLKPAVETIAGALKSVAPIVAAITDFIKNTGGALKESYDYWNVRMSSHPDGLNAESRKALDERLGAMVGGLKSGRLPVLPKSMGGLTPAPKVAAAAAMAGGTDAISGGGKKVINIVFNAPLIGKQEYSVGSMQEALSVGANDFIANYLRVLQGATAAL